MTADRSRQCQKLLAWGGDRAEPNGPTVAERLRKLFIFL